MKKLKRWTKLVTGKENGWNNGQAKERDWKDGKWKILAKNFRINGLGAQAKVFSQSSPMGFCQSRGICHDIVDISSDLFKLMKDILFPIVLRSLAESLVLVLSSRLPELLEKWNKILCFWIKKRWKCKNQFVQCPILNVNLCSFDLTIIPPKN